MASSKKRSKASGKAREEVELGGDIDALFTKPLGDFTQARNELAKSLRKTGDRARAAQVAATKKPSVAAWTLNQLARRYPQRMDALLEAGERLREAQRGALEPGGAKGLREASVAHRALVNELLRAAPSLLEEAGYRAGGGNIDRVRDSLLAAPTARKEDLERLERGRLTQEIEPGDLTDVLGLMRGRPGARPQEEAKARAEEVEKAAPVKTREAPTTTEKPKAQQPKAEKPKRKVAEARPAKTSKAAEREEKKRLATEKREEKKRAAQEREEKKKRAAQEREEKKRLAAEEREEKKRLAEAQRERDQAGREAARAAKEAERQSREAERLMRVAEEAAEAAKRAMELARDAERGAREAQKQAEEAARRLEAAERALDK